MPPPAWGGGGPPRRAPRPNAPSEAGGGGGHLAPAAPRPYQPQPAISTRGTAPVQYAGMETESTVVDEKGEEIVEVQPRRRNGPPAPPTTANVTPAGSGWDGRATNGGGEGGANFNPDVPPGYTGGGPVQPPSGGHARGHGRQPPPPPCTKRTKWDDASDFIDGLDQDEVETWTIQDIKTKFLTPLNMEQIGYVFENNRINGRTLSIIGKEELNDLNIKCIGDRVYLFELLKIMKKAFKRNERDKVIWEARVPPEEGANIAYFSGEHGPCWQCFSWCQWKICPCCVATVDYRFTKQGLGEKINPPSISICCSTVTNRFHNLAFMKDVDWDTMPEYCGLATRKRLIMFFLEEGLNMEDVQSTAGMTEQEQKDHFKRANEAADDKMEILHPSINQELVNTIMYAWSEARLVASSTNA